MEEDEAGLQETIDSLLLEVEELRKNVDVLRERNFTLMQEKNAAIKEANRLRKLLSKEKAGAS